MDNRNISPVILNRLKDIQLVVTDVDGVLTDGGLYYGVNGECLKKFHTRDGIGIRRLQQNGIVVAILSGHDCQPLRTRLSDLKISIFALDKIDKKKAFLDIIQKSRICSQKTAYIGDDFPDTEVFELCGLSITVNDAPEYVCAKADIVLQSSGGSGALGELAYMILSN